jgi:hypothetical protein
MTIYNKFAFLALLAAVSCTKNRNSDAKTDVEGNAALIFDENNYTYSLEFSGTTVAVEPVFTQVQTPQVFLLSEASSTESNEGSSSTVYPIFNAVVTGKTHRCEGKSVSFSDRIPMNCVERFGTVTTSPQAVGSGCVVGSAATLDGVSTTLEDNAGQLQVSFDPALISNPTQFQLKSVTYSFGAAQSATYLPSNVVLRGTKVAANTGSLTLNYTNSTFTLVYTVNNTSFRVGTVATTSPISGTAPNAIYPVTLDTGICIGKYKTAAAAATPSPGYIVISK